MSPASCGAHPWHQTEVRAALLLQFKEISDESRSGQAVFYVKQTHFKKAERTGVTAGPILFASICGPASSRACNEFPSSASLLTGK